MKSNKWQCPQRISFVPQLLLVYIYSNFVFNKIILLDRMLKGLSSKTIQSQYYVDSFQYFMADTRQGLLKWTTSQAQFLLFYFSLLKKKTNFNCSVYIYLLLKKTSTCLFFYILFDHFVYITLELEWTTCRAPGSVACQQSLVGIPIAGSFSSLASTSNASSFSLTFSWTDVGKISVPFSLL